MTDARGKCYPLRKGEQKRKSSQSYRRLSGKRQAKAFLLQDKRGSNIEPARPKNMKAKEGENGSFLVVTFKNVGVEVLLL